MRNETLLSSCYFIFSGPRWIMRALHTVRLNMDPDPLYSRGMLLYLLSIHCIFVLFIGIFNGAVLLVLPWVLGSWELGEWELGLSIFGELQWL